MIRTLHYVRHHAKLDWLRCGWIIVKPNCQMYMDEFSVTMEWLCDCPIVKPEPELNATLRNWLASRNHRVPEASQGNAERV